MCSKPIPCLASPATGLLPSGHESEVFDNALYVSNGTIQTIADINSISIVQNLFSRISAAKLLPRSAAGSYSSAGRASGALRETPIPPDSPSFIARSQRFLGCSIRFRTVQFGRHAAKRRFSRGVAPSQPADSVFEHLLYSNDTQKREREYGDS